LSAGIFANHQVTAVPIHHGTNLRYIPVIEPEHINPLFGKSPAQVTEALLDPVGQHNRLPAVFFFQCFIHGR
jgi:hypothetical protein